MADLPPPPRDPVVDTDRTVSQPWLRWLTSLVAAVVASATSTALTALEATVTAIDAAYQSADAAMDARVSALEVDWRDASVDASFFEAATGSWSVTIATDLIVYRYRRIGNTVQFTVRVDTSSIASTPSLLRIYLPNGMVISAFATGVFWHFNATTAVDAAGLWFATPGLRYLVLTRNAAATAFGNATDQFFVYLSGQCEVAA